MNSLRLFNRFAEHFTIKIISHCIHMSMLLRTQKISGTAKLQIPHRNLKSTSQICILTDCSQTFLRCLFQHHILSVHQERIGSSVRTPYPSPKLIELGKSISVRVMNDHGIYIGNIQSCFYDRSRNQHINISIYKGIHNIFQFSLTHLPMGKIHSRIRHQLCNT